MVQKKMYKVLCMLPLKDGGTHWMRCGSGFTNKDDSINIHLDALPRGEWKFQLRELDEEDLRRREANRTRHASSPPAAAPATLGLGLGVGLAGQPTDQPPF